LTLFSPHASLKFGKATSLCRVKLYIIILLEANMPMNVDTPITVLPYKAPRKHRKPENAISMVKWLDGDMMYFSSFKRDSSAIAYMNLLIDSGYQASVVMK